MIRTLLAALVCLAALSGCDPSYSDVRDVPALPGSEASPVQVTPRLKVRGDPETYTPGDLWRPTLQVDSLTARTFGVAMLGHQRHTIRDTVSMADLTAFFDERLGRRGFRRSRAPEAWQVDYTHNVQRAPQVAAWVHEAPAEGGGTDRTVVSVAYATPWPSVNRTTYYVVFLGRSASRSMALKSRHTSRPESM